MPPALNVRASGANGARHPAEPLHPVLPNAIENPAIQLFSFTYDLFNAKNILTGKDVELSDHLGHQGNFTLDGNDVTHDPRWRLTNSELLQSRKEYG